jgi:uncharacterized protein YozE (UPF0346 family)
MRESSTWLQKHGAFYKNMERFTKIWRVLQKYGATYSRNITKLVGCYLKKILP